MPPPPSLPWKSWNAASIPTTKAYMVALIGGRHSLTTMLVVSAMLMVVGGATTNDGNREKHVRIYLSTRVNDWNREKHVRINLRTRVPWERLLELRRLAWEKGATMPLQQYMHQLWKRSTIRHRNISSDLLRLLKTSALILLTILEQSTIWGCIESICHTCQLQLQLWGAWSVHLSLIRDDCVFVCYTISDNRWNRRDHNVWDQLQRMHLFQKSQIMNAFRTPIGYFEKTLQYLSTWWRVRFRWLSSLIYGYIIYDRQDLCRYLVISVFQSLRPRGSALCGEASNLVYSRIIWCDWEQPTELCFRPGSNHRASTPW
jgi:hypothetical protein